MRGILVFLSILFSATAFAEEAGSVATNAGQEIRDKHALALFVGATRENDEDLATVGIEYSYRFHENFTVGGVVERADRNKHSTLVLAFINYLAWKGLILGFGVGKKDPGDEKRNTLRAAVSYEFEVGGGWSIGPQVALDFIGHEEDEAVYGIAIGRRF